MDSRDYYPFIVDRAPVGIYILSKDGFEFINPAFERITGYSLEDLRQDGPGFLAHIHEEDRGLQLERRQARLEGRPIPPTYQMKIIAKDGTVKTLELDTAPVPGHDGSVLGILRDVTRQKSSEDKLRESETKFRRLVERANEGIVIVQDGAIIYANPFMKEICGYEPGELTGQPFHRFVDTGYVAMMLDRHKRRLSGDSVISTYETVLKNKDSRRVHVDVDINEYISEGKTTYLTVIHDITRHKAMEERLRAALDKVRHAMNGTIQAISMVLETRDPYTAGHQRRVADLARAIASEMGLSEEQIDTIRVAGTLHDIGKIAIPAEILSKPTPLTDIERELIKKHPGVAYDILKTVDFPWAIADIVHQHHERLDGTGYPQSLRGPGILCEAKILAVADVTEAMISHRPYRAALDLESVLAELARYKGEWYDPDAVDACIRLFKEKGFAFPAWAAAGHPK